MLRGTDTASLCAIWCRSKYISQENLMKSTRHRNFAIFTLAALITSAWSARAQVQVSLNGVTYDVTVDSTTFNGAETTLETQPEWNSSADAESIATQYATALPNNGPRTFFMYADLSAN